MLTTFGVRGSKRLNSGEQTAINTRLDLVQFFYFERALEPVIKHLRKERDDLKRKREQADQFDDEMSKLRRELDKRQKDQKDKEAKSKDPI